MNSLYIRLKMVLYSRLYKNIMHHTMIVFEIFEKKKRYLDNEMLY